MPSLLTEGEPRPQRLFTGVTHRVQDWGPIRLWRENREFDKTAKRTALKLLNDIREGGLLSMQRSIRPQKEYWVWLRNNDDQKYAVRAVLDYPGPWRDSIVHINASDDGLPPGESSRLFTARMELGSDIGSTIPFTSDKWHGEITTDCYQVIQEKQRPLEMREKRVFLDELFTAGIDKSTTQTEYEQASRRSASVYRVKGAHISYWT